MKPLIKVGLIVAGYVVAFLIAVAVVAIHVSVTSGPDRDGAAGMYGFGDDLLFLAVFGVAAVPPTGAALFLLRRYRPFWITLAASALCIAATGLPALANHVLPPRADA